MLLEKIQLEPNEEILQTVRKHWFILFSELFGVLVMLLAPLFVMVVAAFIPNLPETLNIFSEYLVLSSYFIIVWIIFCLLSAFTIWTHYYLDLWVVTNRRLLVIDQIHFFNRKVSSFRLERLQDIKVLISGVIPTFLNFGTIRAQTASAADSAFTSTGLPDPRGLQAIIQKATDERLRDLNQPASLLTD